eukprot:scaffold447_cov307-Pinguiococcus_pyrenoidosus.AAC.16
MPPRRAPTGCRSLVMGRPSKLGGTSVSAAETASPRGGVRALQSVQSVYVSTKVSISREAVAHVPRGKRRNRRESHREAD